MISARQMERGESRGAVDADFGGAEALLVVVAFKIFSSEFAGGIEVVSVIVFGGLRPFLDLALGGGRLESGK